LSVKVAFPKNLEATNLSIKAGTYSLSADVIRTDATSIVEAQASAVGEVAGAAVKALVP
jgi:hypothetical protein